MHGVQVEGFLPPPQLTYGIGPLSLGTGHSLIRCCPFLTVPPPSTLLLLVVHSENKNSASGAPLAGGSLWFTFYMLRGGPRLEII